MGEKMSWTERFQIMIKMGIFDLDLRSDEEKEKETEQVKIFEDFLNKLNLSKQ